MNTVEDIRNTIYEVIPVELEGRTNMQDVILPIMHQDVKKKKRRFSYYRPYASPTNRIVKKCGKYNVLRTNIPEKTSRYVRDLGNTLLSIRWRWILISVCIANGIAYLLFTLLWMAMVVWEESYMSEDAKEPCITGTSSFAGYLILVVETMTTIGSGEITPTDCQTGWVMMTLQALASVTIEGALITAVFVKMSRPNNKNLDTFNGSNLYFWRLDRKQMGAYLCIASNDVPPAVSKRISLNVNFAPVIKVPNQLLGAPLNTDVQLECYVEAFPNTINYWVKNRGEMLLNGTKYHIREEKSGYKVFMWLVIKAFSPEDIGTYNCISTNSLGRAEGTLRLYEIKVGPGGPHENHISIVGGLAEPARGHRSRENDVYSSTTRSHRRTPALLQLFLSALPLTLYMR